MSLFESSEQFEDDDVNDAVAEPSTEQISEDAFESGLNHTLGIEQEVKTPEPKPETKEEVKSLFEVTEDEFNTIRNKANLVDELNNRLTKTHDTAFGKIGQLEQTIRELKQRSDEAPARTPLTKESFSKLAEYLDDEEMAEALAADLSSLQLGGSSSESAFDKEAFNASIEEKFAAMSQEFAAAYEQKADATAKDFETKLLTIQHNDWREIAASEEFAAWKGTLKDEARETLDNAWDGVVLANAFTSFKQWKSKKAEVAEKKQQRLEDGIQPARSSGRNQTPSDDAFNQGLKKVLTQ
jgi:hypothetical protein